MYSILSENQFAISDCHIPSHLPDCRQLLCGCHFFECTALLSANAIHLFIFFFWSVAALKSKKIRSWWRRPLVFRKGALGGVKVVGFISVGDEGDPPYSSLNTERAPGMSDRVLISPGLMWRGTALAQDTPNRCLAHNSCSYMCTFCFFPMIPIDDFGAAVSMWGDLSLQSGIYMHSCA